jgi:hypothetical protein
LNEHFTALREGIVSFSATYPSFLYRIFFGIQPQYVLFFKVPIHHI